MATLSYFLRSKSDNASIYCRLTIDRKTQFEKKTGLTIDKKYWSTDKKLPKQTAPAIEKQIKSQLERLKVHIQEKANQALTNGKMITSVWLGQQIEVFFGLASETGHDDSLVAAIDRFIFNAQQKRGLAVNTIKKYEYLKSKLVAYQGKDLFRVKDVNMFFADSFLKWLQEEKWLSEGTANKVLRNLITVCKEAKTYEIETAQSLENIKTKRHEKKNKIYLTPKELQKIKKANILPDYLNNARKWLLLGCEIGQRVSDLKKVNEKNVVDYEGMRFLVIHTQKTKKEVIIPIVGRIEEILKDGFPRPISATNLNKYIKKVCELAEIDTPTVGEKRDPETNRLISGTFQKHELITSHCMRYTFVTNSKNIISNQLIRTVTAHTTDRMMESYNAKEQLKVAKELGEIWQKQFEERSAPMAVNE